MAHPLAETLLYNFQIISLRKIVQIGTHSQIQNVLPSTCSLKCARRYCHDERQPCNAIVIYNISAIWQSTHAVRCVVLCWLGFVMLCRGMFGAVVYVCVYVWVLVCLGARCVYCVLHVAHATCFMLYVLLTCLLCRVCLCIWVVSWV